MSIDRDTQNKAAEFTTSGIELNYLVALNASESFKRNFKSLYSQFGTFEKIFNATEEQLKGIPGLAPQTTRALANIKQQYKPGFGMERIQGRNIRIVTFWSDEYPRSLKEISSPPPVLYVKGDINYKFELSIAIVGTRRANLYGREQAFRFGKELGELGFTVISGGASGIDSEAHRGVLEAGWKTFAVMGSGIDITFPSMNENLFKQISEKGALISEFPPGTPPEPYRFPVRNRIIAGMSRGVLVIQAPERSGALITSDYAMEMGREVFAIMGRIDDSLSEGTNMLIRDGANMVMSPDDIMNVFHMIVEKRKEKAALPPLDSLRQRVLDQVGWEPKHIDDISHDLEMPVSQLSGLVLGLQMDGYIKELTGKRYVRLAP